MSRNIYLRRNNTPAAREEVNRFLVNSEFEQATDYIDSMETGIHIGLCSYGWKFMVPDHDGKFYEKSFESYKKFLHYMTSDGEWTIYDENNHIMSLNEIVELIEKKKNGLTRAEYFKIHPEEITPFIDIDDEDIIDGIRFCPGDKYF